MMKETGIDRIYEDFCYHGYIYSWEEFNFRDDGIICTIKVIELENVIRLFICVNGQVKKSEILANYKKRG